MTDSWITEEDDVPKAKEERKFDDIEIGEDFVEDLPPQAGSLYAEVVGKLIEAAEDGNTGWLVLSTGGRATNTVQTGLQNAARTLNVRVQTRSRKVDGEEKVYARLAQEEEKGK